MTKEINISIHDFYSQFEKEYNFLWEQDDPSRVAGFAEAADAFDDFLNAHADFVREFVMYRGDTIDGSREAAAFMFALDAMTDS